MSNNFKFPISNFQLSSLSGITAWGVVKWFVVVGLLMYAFFAVVVLRQVAVMMESVEAEANGWVKLVAWLHLLGAMALVVLSVVVL